MKQGGMNIHALDSYMEKRYLLDILAYILWHKNIDKELSFSHFNLCKTIYREILNDLKSQVQWYSSSNQKDFSSINIECYDLGNLCFLEKRLDLIEKILADRFQFDLLLENNELRSTQLQISEPDDEPFYDDVTLDLIEKQEFALLIEAMVKYSTSLENMVVELRCQVNRLTSTDQPEPFPDLHGDIYEVFYEYPAFQIYKDFFDITE